MPKVINQRSVIDRWFKNYLEIAIRSGSGNLNKPLSGESATVDALTGR